MIEKGIHDKPRCSKECRRSVAKFCTTGGERLALSPTVNIDNTWLSSRTNDTPYHVLVTIINLLMFGKCRDEREVPWTQVLPLVAALADNCAISGKRKDNRVLLAVVMDCRCSMWFGNHARSTNVWSQAHESIRSYHALCLATGDF